MSDSESARAELGNTGYEIFIAALSILSLVNIVLLTRLRDPATQEVVYVLDLLLSLVFLSTSWPACSVHRHGLRSSSAVRLGRPGGEPAVPPGQGAAGVPTRPRRATAAPVRRRERREEPAQGPCRKCAAHVAVGRRPRPAVREPGHAVPGEERAGRHHHDRLRRALVRGRHHLHGRVRRPVPGHQRRTLAGHLHHRRRRRHLRHADRLPGQPLPVAAEGAAPSETPATPAEVLHRVEQVKELLGQQQAALAELEHSLQRQTTTPPPEPNA